jgi:hypothetical protein
VLDLLEQLGRLPAEIWLVPPVVILAGMAAIGMFFRSRRLRRFRAIAERAGLQVRRKVLNPSEISGTFRGRRLMMTITSPQTETWFRRYWTLVVVDFKNPELLRLRMWRQDAIDRVFLAAGWGEVEIGDAAFDRRFVIHSDEPRVVTRLFQDESLRDAIIASDINTVELLNAQMRVFYGREERDPAHAELLFTAVTRLADAIDALRPDYRPEIIG